MTFPDCKNCYAMTDVPCEHRIKYMSAERFIKDYEIEGASISITDVTAEPNKEYYEPPEKHWKAGKCDLTGGPTIRLWPLAHTMYGWDVMTSVLIHEFGHLKLYQVERLSTGLEAENKANRYGSWHFRQDLIPRHYWLHRELFLMSHIEPDNWDAAKCRSEYAKWITWMKDAPTVRAFSMFP
jgi:hypothetical protein